MARFAALAASFAAVAVMAQAATAGVVSDAPSTISAKVKGDAVTGRVGSTQSACLGNRTVVVIPVGKGRHGSLGKTTTDSAGRWSVEFRSWAEGKTRVRAEVRNGFTPEFNCLKAHSPIRVHHEPPRN